MNPRRFATVAPALCGTVVLAGLIVGWLAGFGSAGIKNTGAVPIENRAAALTANAKLADGIRLLKELAINATRPQHERGGETTDTTADDDRFHGLNSTQPRMQPDDR